MTEDVVGEFRVIGDERWFYLAVVKHAAEERSLSLYGKHPVSFDLELQWS